MKYLTSWYTITWVICFFLLFAVYSFKEQPLIAALYGIGAVITIGLEEIRKAIVRK